MKLTIGMAHFDDFHGAVFTIQSIRMNKVFREKDIEILVIDNSPESRHGKALKNFCHGTGVRYIPFVDSEGTSQTRQAIFDNASGDAVLCMDCHVLLFNNSLPRLIEFYENNPNTKNLYTGPLYLDNLQSHSTHFDLFWRREMWGVWGYARECKSCKYKFSYQPASDHDALDKDVYLSMTPDQQDLKETCPSCGDSLIHSVMNKVNLNEDSEPFEVPAQGLGIFTCMKHAWLGFNKNFRGFGGEEGYIHHKFANAGHKTICLPYLGWWHRFSRPDGVPYQLTADNKIKNYIHGYMEIGLPVEEVKEHFMKEGKIASDEQWVRLLSEAAEGPSKKCCGGKCNTEEKAKFKTVEKPKVKSIAGKNIKEIYESFKGSETEFVKEYLNECESVSSYIKSADHAFNVMSSDKIKRYNLHHIDPKQAVSIFSLCPEGLDREILPFEEGPNEDVDCLMVNTYNNNKDLSRILSYENKARKFLIVSGNSHIMNEMKNWIVKNRDWHLIKIGVDKATTFIFSRDSSYQVEPISLGEMGSGPGTELKKSLAFFGIVPTQNCKCTHRANMMDVMGPEWCKKNIEKIIGWLKEEADIRNMPFNKTLTKVFVNRAIKRYEKARAREKN